MEPTLETLGRSIRHCMRCERCRSRRHAVPGEGAARRKILLLGEAPGKTEDQTGRPFAGRTGRWMNQLLAKHGLARDDFFITSILKCYHPDPLKPRQIEACRAWTLQQIGVVRPRLILVMGRAAAGGLLGLKALGEKAVVTRWLHIPCVVTCHPSAAMRFPARGKRFRRDFRRLLEMVQDARS